MITINKKTYICSLDYAMEIIKGKWKAVIICHLNDSPTRFLELKRKLTGISQKVLTEKLKELEKDKVLEKIVYAELPPKVEYKLTESGIELFLVLNKLQNWADNHVKFEK